ncbi:MAG TPA: hypothetical protein VK149_06440 [Sideroxyarcus sp.]|nr:hypothetical protein [Sideroxyarcus sp.]
MVELRAVTVTVVEAELSEGTEVGDAESVSVVAVVFVFAVVGVVLPPQLTSSAANAADIK